MPKRMGYRCRTCGKPIVWAKHQRTGKWMPLETAHFPGAKILVFDGPPITYLIEVDQLDFFTDEHNIPNRRTVSHYVTCPKASTHRKAAVV